MSNFDPRLQTVAERVKRFDSVKGILDGLLIYWVAEAVNGFRVPHVSNEMLDAFRYQSRQALQNQQAIDGIGRMPLSKPTTWKFTAFESLAPSR